MHLMHLYRLMVGGKRFELPTSSMSRKRLNVKSLTFRAILSITYEMITHICKPFPQNRIPRDRVGYDLHHAKIIAKPFTI